MPMGAKKQIRDADILIFESNYEDSLLDADERRPWVTKQRIRSRHGHLSNKIAAKELSSIENPNWKHLILSHLSKDCNSIDCVRSAFDELFRKMKNLNFDIIDPQNGSAVVKTF
jgi:phosphoribosyl 1,2-cyclic phosphodiesterase